MLHGSHIGFNTTLANTIRSALLLKINSIQFFLGSPQGYSRTKISDDDIKECLSLIGDKDFSVVSHFPYVANLCGSKEILAWNGDDDQDRKTTAMLKGLTYELSVLANFKRNGVVIHPGNHNIKNIGLSTISTTINKIDFADNAMLLLENTAGGGTSLCGTFEEIKIVMDGVMESKKKHIGVCIDTCHLHAYGDYNLSLKEEIKRFFKDFHRIIGIEHFRLLHLNDSECPHKSRKDRHANICTGVIWKDDNKALRYLLKCCKKYDIPIVLETTSIDIPVLQELIKKYE